MRQLPVLFAVYLCSVVPQAIAQVFPYRVETVGHAPSGGLVSSTVYTKLNNRSELVGSKDGVGRLRVAGQQVQVTGSNDPSTGLPRELLGTYFGISDEGCIAADEESWCPFAAGGQRGYEARFPGLRLVAINDYGFGAAYFGNVFMSDHLSGEVVPTNISGLPEQISNSPEPVIVGTANLGGESPTQAFAIKYIPGAVVPEENWRIWRIGDRLGGYVSYAKGVNNRREVVGSVAQRDQFGFLKPPAPFWYNLDTDEFEVLNLVGSLASINNGGVAVGSGPLGLFLYSHGPASGSSARQTESLVATSEIQFISADRLPGVDTSNLLALDINDSGQILMRDQNSGNSYAITPPHRVWVHDPDPVTTSGSESVASARRKFRLPKFPGNPESPPLPGVSPTLNAQRFCREMPEDPDFSIFENVISGKYVRVKLEDLSPGDGAVASLNASRVFDYNRDQVGFLQMMAYYHSTKFRDYLSKFPLIESKFGARRFDVILRNEQSYAHPATGEIVLSKSVQTDIGLNRTTIADAEDARVIVHELGHRTLGIIGTFSIGDEKVSEARALDVEGKAFREGYSDYLAASYFAGSGPLTYHPFDALYTPWAARAPDNGVAPGPVGLGRPDRDLTVRKLFSDFGTADDLEHENGQITSSALWRIRSKFGDPSAFDRLVLLSGVSFPTGAGPAGFAKALIKSMRMSADIEISQHVDEAEVELCLSGLLQRFRSVEIDSLSVVGGGGNKITGKVTSECSSAYYDQKVYVHSNSTKVVVEPVVIERRKDLGEFAFVTKKVASVTNVTLTFILNAGESIPFSVQLRP